jgi:hypothetical protein
MRPDQEELMKLGALVLGAAAAGASGYGALAERAESDHPS